MAKAKDSESDLAQPPAPLPPLVASTIPQVEPPSVLPESGIDACSFPSDDRFTDGIYEMGGEKYALCIHEEDGYGNTHSLKNSLHTWQGKEADFNGKFKLSK